MKIQDLDPILQEAGGYVARNAKEAADPRWSMSIGGDVTTHTMRNMMKAFYPSPPQKGEKQTVVKESKVDMCPEACCGKPVTECKCGAECEHCDCFEVNNKVNANNRNYGMRKASGQGDNPMMAEKRPDHEVEMGSELTESDTPGFDMINRIFDSLTDDEKVDIQRQLTVKVRGISVPPIGGGLGKLKDRNPNDKDIADMPLSQLKKSYSGVVEVAGPKDCWDGYKKDGTQAGTGKNKGKRVNKCVKEEEITLEDDENFHDVFGQVAYSIDENDLFEAEYQGRTVKLNKPMQGDVKKSKVYVKNDKGNVIKVNFGHGGTSAKAKGEKTMSIKKNNPARRKSFRARHNCSNPGPKTKARYWSCRAW